MHRSSSGGAAGDDAAARWEDDLGAGRGPDGPPPTARFTWTDARAALAGLGEVEHGVLLLLARLPLAPARLLAALAGTRSQVGHAVVGLREAGLLDAVRPALGRCRCERLWHLTDLGLVVVALDQGVEPRSLAERQRLRGVHLANRLAAVERHLGVYELLAAVAATFPEPPELLAWEQPWRRRVLLPRWTRPVRVVLPAYAALAAGEQACASLLMPDQPDTPVEAHRTTLVRLTALAARDRTVPTLLVATDDAERAADWRRLLDDVAAARGVLLAASVVGWHELVGGGWSAADTCPGGAAPDALVRRVRLPPLRERVKAERGLCRLVGVGPTEMSARVQLGDPGSCAALVLDPGERALLRTVARQPFLPSEALYLVVNGRPGATGRRLERLRTLGLVRLLGPDEVGPVAARGHLVEATRAGLDLVAAELGPTRARAYRVHGLTGGGPTAPVGRRDRLLGQLQHTLGINEFVVALCRAALGRRDKGGDDALVGWWNEAVCADGALKPDGLGAFRRAGWRHLFFLELDRGTEAAVHYRKKFAIYREHRDSGRLAHRHGEVPTVLLATATTEAEIRAARVLRSLARRDEVLPVLLTTLRRIREDPDGPLGPVWRTAASDHRTAWLADAQGPMAVIALGGGAGAEGGYRERGARVPKPSR